MKPPPPPPGFVLDGSGGPPPPPPGFQLDAPAGRSRVQDPFAGQMLMNKPPPTMRDELKAQFWRSTTGGIFDNWQDASDYYFGTKERNEAKAAGLGVDPTPSEMAQGALFAAGPSLAELPVVAEAPALIRGAASALRANPKTAGAALAAAPDLAKGDLKGAAIDAALAAAGIHGAQKLPLAFRMAKAMSGGASVSEALSVALGESQGAAGAVPRGPIRPIPNPPPEAPPPGPVRPMSGYQASTATPTVPSEPVYIPSDPLRPWLGAPVEAAPAVTQGPERPGNVVQGPMAQSPNTKLPTTSQRGSSTMNTPAGRAAAGKLPSKGVGMIPDQLRAIEEAGGADNPLLGGKAPEAPSKPKPAAKVDPGKEAVAAHGDLRSAAREYGKANPDVDQIYFELDKSGRPVRVISQGQAGALTRKGIKWTWVNNVWGNPRNLRTGS